MGSSRPQSSSRPTSRDQFRGRTRGQSSRRARGRGQHHQARPSARSESPEDHTSPPEQPSSSSKPSQPSKRKKTATGSMASNYNYPPPPLPPQAGPAGYQYQQQPSYGAQPSPRGGGSIRGRGNHHQGRGDYTPQYNSGYGGPPPVAGGYGQQSPAPYMGPQAPQGGYPAAQWPHEQPQQHQQGPAQQQPPPPVPLSVQNYHPNYAPHAYPQPAYGGPQYQQSPPPQNSYPPSQPPHPSGPPQQQWGGQPNHSQASPYGAGGRGRGRGQGGSGRGGYDAPLMGPPIRMGFEGDRSAQAGNNGYYAGPPSHSPVAQSPAPYQQQAYAPQGPPQSGFRGNEHYQSNGFRGRGGFNNRGGRGGYGNDRNRPRPNGAHHGTDLPQKPESDAVDYSNHDKKRKKKKRKHNQLGLTPHGEDHEESEDEELDEEARLVAMLGDDAPKLPSDLQAWIAERKRNFPTAARKQAKEAELAKRRAEEYSTREKSKTRSDGGEKKSKLERKQEKAEQLRKKLEKAEKKLQEAMKAGSKAGSKRKRNVGDIGDEEDGDEGGDVEMDGTGTGAQDYDEKSSSSSDSDSDDERPEKQSSKAAASALPEPPAVPKAQIQRPCKYFSTGGVCGKKGKCRFIHDQAARDAALREKALNGGRMTLAQRMIQNDKEKDDLTVFKSIMQLRARGLLDDPKPNNAQQDGGHIKSESQYGDDEV